MKRIMLLIVVVCLAGCGSTGPDPLMIAALKSTADAHEALKVEYAALTAGHEILRGEHEALRVEHAALQGERDKAMQERADYRTQAEAAAVSSWSAHAALTATHAALTAEHAKVVQEYAAYRKSRGSRVRAPAPLTAQEKLLKARKERLEELRRKYGGKPGYTAAGFKKIEKREPRGGRGR